MAETKIKKAPAKPRVNHNLDNFKKLVRKAIFLEKHEVDQFNLIPNSKWESIFEKNFGSKLAYAHRVLLKEYKEIESIDTVEVDREKKKIYNLEKVTKSITASLKADEKIFFLTDIDNDGSLAQAIINEYLNVDDDAKKNMEVHYTQTVNGNASRGFTVDLIEKIANMRGLDKNASFTVITADNGINSLEEQIKCEAMFPNLKIIVTDHHEPEEGMTIQENKNVTIFNPHYKSTEFFEKFNISGAATINVVLQNLIQTRLTEDEINNEKKKQSIRNMNKISKVSNVLDYVHSHPADKPEKDYVVSRFLELQPLLNINNSITKLITGEIPLDAIEAIRNKIPKLDIDLIHEEAKNIRTQNQNARIWAKIYNQYKDTAVNELPADVNSVFLMELHNLNNYFSDNGDIDENYIGQLRPKIFNLTADDEKTPFMDELNSRMTEVFERVRESEKKIGSELRRGEVITKTRLENSVIAYADKHILSIFNRKFLNKVYNDENPGFSLTLDSVDKNKVSGSFRSLYDISDIFRGKGKQQLEKELGIKIETPGHQRAAGFIIRSQNSDKHTITPSTINRINEFINDSIAELKLKQVESNEQHILTDMSSIGLIDRINATIRGNVAHFDRITPLIKLDKNTIWTDSYTTEQYSLEDICNDRKYGYITVNANFHGDTTIIPVEVVRRIVENNYKDYIQLNYMDGGVFMTDRVVLEKDAKNLLDMRKPETQADLVADVFEKHFTNGKFKVELSREEIKDNPFFKYHDFGELNFELFETMVIRLIDTNKIDTFSVFDVEANGFGNARLMNIGFTNYVINPESGKKMDSTDFFENYFVTSRDEAYILTQDEKSKLTEINIQDLERLTLGERQQVLLHTNEDGVQRWFTSPSDNRVMLRNKLRLPYTSVKNHIVQTDGTVIYNREIKADMLAFLVKDADFKTSQEITNLTGISQDVLDKYGVTTAVVDKALNDYYAPKKGKVLFGAHNTPYDAKIARANLPKFYKTMRDNHIYDSALFSKDLKLAYDQNLTVRFENLPGIPSNIIFNLNPNSDFNIVDIIKKGEDAYFPDRTNRYLLEITDKKFYLIDKEEHDKIKVGSSSYSTLQNLKVLDLFNESVENNLYIPKDIGQDFSPIIDPNNKEYIKVLKQLEADSSIIDRTVYTFNDESKSKIFLVRSVYEDFDDFDMIEKDKYTIVDMSTKKAEVVDLFIGNSEIINSMKISELPGTSIKYSVEKLSEQWMVRALLLNDETFNIEKIDLDRKKYKTLADKSDSLKYFQETYHFDTSMEQNTSKFMIYYYNHHDKSFFDVDEDGNHDAKQIHAFNDFLKEFLKKNKKIQQKFNDAWMYKSVLRIKEPNRGEPITNDMVSLVNYQSNIPEKKIRVIFKEVLSFKEKYKLEHLQQHELHVNGLFEGDKKGDVLFEDKLTLSLLAQRQYNSYEHNIDYAVESFNKYQIDARKSFDIAHHLSDEVANDSYSFRQGLTFDRTNKSVMVKNIQKRENESLRNEYENVIKFKLNNDVLAQDQAIYAIPLEGAKITRENIEEDKQKLSFIMMTIQISNGMGTVAKKDTEIVKYMNNVLASNHEKAMEYKKELAERYRYITYNKRDFNIKKSIDLMISALKREDGIECVESINEETKEKSYFLTGTATMDIPKDDVDHKGLGIIQTVVRDYIENHKRVTNESYPTEEFVQNFIDRITRDREPTALEEALEDEDCKFDDFTTLAERGFLSSVSSKKLNPIKTFFSKTPELRLANQFVESQAQVAKELTPEAVEIWKGVDLKILQAHMENNHTLSEISNGKQLPTAEEIAERERELNDSGSTLKGKKKKADTVDADDGDAPVAAPKAKKKKADTVATDGDGDATVAPKKKKM